MRVCFKTRNIFNGLIIIDKKNYLINTLEKYNYFRVILTKRTTSVVISKFSRIQLVVFNRVCFGRFANDVHAAIHNSNVLVAEFCRYVIFTGYIGPVCPLRETQLNR